MGERKADGISVRVRRKTIYFSVSEDISTSALCHCQCENLQFTASLHSLGSVFCLSVCLSQGHKAVNSAERNQQKTDRRGHSTGHQSPH